MLFEQKVSKPKVEAGASVTFLGVFDKNSENFKTISEVFTANFLTKKKLAVT